MKSFLASITKSFIAFLCIASAILIITVVIYGCLFGNLFGENIKKKVQKSVYIKTDKMSGTKYVEYDDSIYKLVPLIKGGE